jgi:hypothetical protein
MWKSFVLELHAEWSEFADECIALVTLLDMKPRVRTFLEKKMCR